MDRSPGSFDRAIPSCALTWEMVFAHRPCLKDLAPELLRRLGSFVSATPRCALRNQSASMQGSINAYREIGRALALRIFIHACSALSRSKVSPSIHLGWAGSVDMQISPAGSRAELRATLKPLRFEAPTGVRHTPLQTAIDLCPAVARSR